MSRSGDHSHLARELEAPTTPASQVKTYDAIPPSSSRSFLSSVVDLFQQAKTNATNEFDQLYDTFSVPRENATPQKVLYRIMNMISYPKHTNILIKKIFASLAHKFKSTKSREEIPAVNAFRKTRQALCN